MNIIRIHRNRRKCNGNGENTRVNKVNDIAYPNKNVIEVVT